MPDEHVHALHRLLLATCVSLALSGAASSAPVGAFTTSTHVGGRVDGVATTNSSMTAVPTRFHPAQTLSVSNCDDNGPGSLRDTVAAAGEGDTIDLTQLACSAITLTTGAITISQDNLSLIGPGTSLAITRDASAVNRIVSHIGTGTLTLSGLSVMYGYFNYSGGCIQSSGNLTLDNVSVRRCQSGMDFVGKYDHDNHGGAVDVAGNLTMSRSTVALSVCYSRANGRGFGGGLFVGGSADIRESTISGNYAGFTGSPGNVGGITIQGTEPSIIVNSTITDNVANGLLGGVYAYAGLTLSNSTIAFNVAVDGLTTPRVPAGVQAYYGPLTMNSTIISNNVAAGGEYDLYAFGAVSGTNNLVMSSSSSPPGTLTADPDLQGLADNGGATKTLALLPTSVAIDAGNNVFGASTDQRGAGFARVGGGQADIGAFELQVAAPATYTIGGNIVGLAGTGLVLQQNGGDNLPIASSGSFTFTTALSDASGYDVTVLAQPTSPNQTCVVTNGQGVVAGANVTNVAVTCTTTTYTVGGTVDGLLGSGLVLQKNGSEDLPIAADGSFTFPTPLADGGTFTVSTSVQPSDPAQTCVVANGSGTLAGADITDIAVACSTDVTDRIFADDFE